MKNLKEKKQTLEDRLEVAKKSKQQTLERTGEEGKRKLLKAKRQWEQDEKTHFEKIAANAVFKKFDKPFKRF